MRVTHSATVRLVTALTAAILAACSNGGSDGLTGLAKKKSEEKASEEPQAADPAAGKNETVSDPEGAPVSEPVVVSGTFLCAPATDFAPADGETAWGCAVHQQDKKLAGAVGASRVTSATANGRLIEPKTTKAADDSPWHFHFGVTPADAAEIAVLEAYVVIAGELYASKPVTFTGGLEELTAELMPVQVTLGSQDGLDAGLAAIDFGAAVAAMVASPKRSKAVHVIFETSMEFVGNVGGLEGADKRCLDAATAADFADLGPVSWHALLATANDQSRFQIGHPVLNNAHTARQLVADASSGSLVTAQLMSALNFDEKRNQVPGDEATNVAWTGLPPMGFSGDFCADWLDTQNNIEGYFARPVSVPPVLNAGKTICGGPRHLLCMSVPTSL